MRISMGNNGAIIVIGELLWDLLPSGEMLGGAPANFAYRLNALGSEALLVTRIGQDERGKRAHRIVQELGLNDKFIQWDEDYPTGTVDVYFDDEKNPDYFIVPDVAYDHIQYSVELESAIKTASCIAWGTLCLRATETRTTIENILKRSPGVLKFLDINLRKNCYTKETVLLSLEYADVLKLNSDEALCLNKMFNLNTKGFPVISKLLVEQFGLQLCIITLEERGGIVASSSDGLVYSPGFRIELEDSLGAGDAFSAGFLHTYMNGKNLSEAGRIGNAYGALVASQKGATQRIMPSDIRRFLDEDTPQIYDKDLKMEL